MRKAQPKTVIRRAPQKNVGLPLYATTFAGLEPVLERELKSLGARETSQSVRGVSFRGDISLVYRANLWLRTAHRVLVEIAEFEAKDRESLYDGVRTIDWSKHLSVRNTLAVDAVSSRSEMDHTQFVSRVVKDAVVDQFRDKHGVRPNVDPKNPDLALNARIFNNRCTLSWDTSGHRLNQRGYRSSFGGTAPLKENLAAGLVLLSGFDGTAPLVDPMCGSGTILIEAAMIAKNQAPGALGRGFNFMNHPTFDKPVWTNVFEDAKTAVKDVDVCQISGSDIDENAVRAARTAAQGAGVDDIIRIRRLDARDLAVHDRGQLVFNPPYGERLGEISQLSDLYASFGDVMKTRCRGMTAHLLAGSKFLAGKIGLKSKRRDTIWNGAIECRFMHFDLY